MRSTLLTIFGVLVSILNTTAQYWEDFSSFPNGWAGDTAEFVVTQDEELRSDGTGTDELELVTSTGIVSFGEREWRIYARLPFSPSSSNNARAYFSSTFDSTGALISGMYLQLGESGGADAPEVHVVSQGVDTVLLRALDSLIAQGMDHEVRVRFDGDSLWSMSLRSGKAGEWNGVASGQFQWVPTGDSLRISLDFTSTRADLFHFDNLYTGQWVGDTIPPKVDSLKVVSLTEMTLEFSENVLPDSVVVLVDGVGVTSIITPGDSSRLSLTGYPQLENDASHSVEVRNIYDAAANKGGDTTLTFHLMLAEEPLPGDIVINEVLFNPITGGEDYVELYNLSEKVFDLSELSLARLNDDTLDQTENCSPAIRWMRPGDYIVVTEDSMWVKENYKVKGANVFAQTDDLPTYWDDTGTVVLLLDSLIIDKTFYSEDMHFALLTDEEGVSLERVDPFGGSMDEKNWGSASESEGFGTPGRQNSQGLNNVSHAEFEVFPVVFSPNGDGDRDQQGVYLSPGEGEWVVTIRIFDRQGRLIRTLWNQVLLVNEGHTFWNGENENRALVSMGPYVLVAEGFNSKGQFFLEKVRSVVSPQ